MSATNPILRVGLAGLGTVGAGVWRGVASQQALLRQRIPTEIRIDQVAVRRPERAREIGVPEKLVTPDFRKLIANPDLDVIVELIGGTTDAFDLIQQSLQNGKHVITANKALLAERGAELFQTALKHRRHLLFEASVAGGIPIIRALREGLVANRIVSIHGIINGTCNYILTRMNEGGLEFADALAEAKRLGYAEADDSLDVDGHDTAHKAAVLAALAYGFWVPPGRLYTEGLRRVEKQDIIYARKLGYALKLLAIIKTDPDGAVEVRVHPTLIPQSNLLASVSGVFNAVQVRGDVVGDTLYYGRGAGGNPTASAVLSDLAELASHYPEEKKARNVGHEALHSRLKTMDEIVSRYYLRLIVVDRPGVLADVARVLATRQIGISSVIQPEAHVGETTPLVLMLHDASEAQFQAAVQEISKIGAVKAPPVHLRVEDFEEFEVAAAGSVADRATATLSILKAPANPTSCPMMQRKTLYPWPGVLEQYRAYMSWIPEGAKIVTLQEGNTALVPAPRLVQEAGGGFELFLKYEAANPTASFKDRGMTAAMTQALVRGAKLVICASTGNTSASAAAYAGRAGLRCAVLLPHGKIALGKLAQARMYGAEIIALRGNFDDALRLVRELGERPGVEVVNSINPVRIEGQKTAAFEICDVLGRAPDYHFLPVGNAGNITAYWKGFKEYQQHGIISSLPKMCGFQAAGAAPIVEGKPVSDPQTIATAIRIGNPASWQGATTAIAESQGLIESVTDAEILAAYALVARLEGLFAEPASVAPLAGLLRMGRRGLIPKGSLITLTLTGHGLKDPDTAMDQNKFDAVVVEPQVDAVLKNLGFR